MTTEQDRLEYSRKVLANPKDSAEYLRLRAAQEAISAARTEEGEAMAAFMAVLKPARDERAKASGRCQADRDGDCSCEWCPQLRDNEPATSGRSCPLPDGREEY